MKILQICHKMPYPLHDGGAYSICHSAFGMMLQGLSVKVLALNPLKDHVNVDEIPAEFREKTGFRQVTADTGIKPFQAFINLFSSRSYFVERFRSAAFKAALEEILGKEEFDIIQLEHVYMCIYLPLIRRLSNAKVILRPQNVENHVWKRLMEGMAGQLKKRYLGIAVKRLLKFEMEMAAAVDGILAISAGDAETFRSYSPGTPVAAVPAGFDFSRIRKLDTEKQFEAFPVFYHLGSMDWRPNAEGIKWFVEDVLPFIRKEYPGFTFRIAGKKMPAWFFGRQDDHLIVDGEVNDSIGYQEDKAVMIVPLLSGGGIRIKIIEGMAMGKTIITTTTGAEGIPCRDGENILIADTKEDFLRQVIKCRDSIGFCRETGKKAQLFAMENYDITRTGRSMVNFYRTILM